MMIPTRCWILLLVLGLNACGSVPTVPETTYYRLPEPAPSVRLSDPVLDWPIRVDLFTADGLYSDQALIYALDADASRLRTYHYQLWIDPPSRLFQRHLMAQLRASGISRIVTDTLPPQLEALRIQGRIVQLDRIQTETGWEVAVALTLRAEPARGGRPWVIREYRQRLPVSGTRVVDSVQTIGQALEVIEQAFIADLIQHVQQQKHTDSVRIQQE